MMHVASSNAPFSRDIEGHLVDSHGPGIALSCPRQHTSAEDLSIHSHRCSCCSFNPCYFACYTSFEKHSFSSGVFKT